MKKIIKKAGSTMDFVLGTVPIGTASYAVERLRQMRFTGLPIRLVDEAFHWFGQHWQEGTLEARKAVAIGRVATFVDMLRNIGMPITRTNLADAMTTIGLTPAQAMSCVDTIEERDLVTLIPEVAHA